MDTIKNFLGDFYKGMTLAIIILLMISVFTDQNVVVNNILAIAAIITFPLSFADFCSSASDFAKAKEQPKEKIFFYSLFWIGIATTLGIFIKLIILLTQQGWERPFYQDYGIPIAYVGSLSGALFFYTLAIKREIEIVENKGKGKLMNLTNILIVIAVTFIVVWNVKQ
ncbi:hypothetical protein [Neobacillus terrae]|uniref:hypothetical protein n=1 Tax=Neobacillus terrae TaxID=3034837 RepID=UPI00140B7C92|nr:hypothetical protein [Neobacillus terrae]NHM29013.1 hypothetical protein [Neobacillus terrae]